MIIIGLMSDTSADAIDAAVCEISGEPPGLNARVIRAVKVPHDADFRVRILAACDPKKSHVDALALLNADLGDAFAQAAQIVMREARVRPGGIDLIASHGQTVWHAVDEDGRTQATLQLGEASIIAERTGVTTIDNFRPRDVAVGGQGAPLTAYADWLLLRHPTRWRAVQNIGGIGNITFLPPYCDEQTRPLAFDTGPGNVLIDTAVSLLTQGAMAYDQDGRMALEGQVDYALLAFLLDDPYFERLPPKVTGCDLYSAAMAAEIVQMAKTRSLKAADIVTTLTALTARSIAHAVKRFAPAPIDELIVGGGGRRNPALMSMLGKAIEPTHLLTHEDVGLDSDAKGALMVALLAHETWHHRAGNLPALTGAKRPAVLGQITPGRNYPELIRRTWGK